MVIAVCVAWVDRRPEVDPTTGAVSVDERTSGLSLADAAAIEWALRSRQRCTGSVLALTVGPPAADAVLRDALAAGADDAMRIDVGGDLDAASVAACLAAALAAARPTLVWCGDLGADGGSGAVPAFIAARLGIASALGLVEVSFEELPDPTSRADRADPSILATRRLDGGRRERLRITSPAVLAVEGATARLRRATLAGTLAATRASITVGAPPPGWRRSSARLTITAAGPYRPRPRLLPAPNGVSAQERIRQLTGTALTTGDGTRNTATTAARPAPAFMSPAAAADKILVALAAWGYERR